MPAVADTQNTIVKEFEGNPDVVVALFDEGSLIMPTQEDTEFLWSTFYLRGQLILDQTGTTARGYYNQPWTGIPFGRIFIIDQAGNVALPMYGHNPQKVIEEVYALLGK